MHLLSPFTFSQFLTRTQFLTKGILFVGELYGSRNDSAVAALTSGATTMSTAMGSSSDPVRILLHGGDNMLGRAVQLSFPTQSPGEERITDSCTAAHYVDLALNHPSGHEHDPSLAEIRRMNENASYLWGDYLHSDFTITPPPDVRILNLETAVCASIHNPDVPLHKGIRYHLHTNNLERAIKAFQSQTHNSRHNEESSSPVLVSFSNNHCMDYGYQAFRDESLPAFRAMQSVFTTVGVGANRKEASQPVRIPIPRQDGNGKAGLPVETMEVVAFATECSGTPPTWGATSKQAGLIALPGVYNKRTVQQALELMKPALSQMSRDSLKIVSIHWGPNWAYKGEDVSEVRARQMLAHALIDDYQVDLIYGHSSHHARGMEVYHNRLILYGTGDIINDYEGFENRGEERYEKLGGVYVVDYDRTTKGFTQLSIVPMFMNRLRLERWKQASKIWQPNERRLENNPSKGREFCQFLNKMSVLDAGGKELALVMEYLNEDPTIPNGPVLKSKAR